MLIVALQDDVDNKFAIWCTVYSEFLGVNLNREDAIKIIMDKKECSREDAESRVEHPQHFSDISIMIENGTPRELDGKEFEVYAKKTGNTVDFSNDSNFFDYETVVIGLDGQLWAYDDMGNSREIDKNEYGLRIGDEIE